MRPVDQANQKSKTKLNENHDLERGDPLCSDIPMFQCGCAQERFAHAHHVKCDLYQNSSAARRHVSVPPLSVSVAAPHLLAAIASTF